MGVIMKDEFLHYFGWITELLKRPIPDYFKHGSEEYAIIERIKNGWGTQDTAELLKGLTAQYGDKAGDAMQKYLEINIIKDWAETGKMEAHEGTEIEDFIHLLWDPLKEQGFEYTMTRENGRVKACVTKCPIQLLAEKTGLHDWLYHLACSTDLYMSPAFSPKTGFTRTKELMKGDDHCNHEYYYREEA
jgi:predicted ArsR family transcriptional regulator